LKIFPGEFDRIIDRALAEDLVSGDPTTLALFPDNLKATAGISIRNAGVLAGLDVALTVFRRLDPNVETRVYFGDGDCLKGGEVVASVAGNLPSLLSAERTALNFIQRMSGIATETSKFVTAVSDTKVIILDTRKTAPGLRAFDKYAVTVGGGRNHRMNLGDGILIKDNHIRMLEASGLKLSQIVARAKSRASHTLRVQVEVETLEDVSSAVEADVDAVLLDNMSLAQMKAAVKIVNGQVAIEASGGVTLDNVAEIAATGVDMISIGALTHSAKALDFGFDFDK